MKACMDDDIYILRLIGQADCFSGLYCDLVAIAFVFISFWLH